MDGTPAGLLDLEKFLSVIDNVIDEGLATLEKAHIRFYRSGQ
jgi:hypothetical protein